MRFSKTAKRMSSAFLCLTMLLSGLMPNSIGGVNAAGNPDVFTASVGDAQEIDRNDTADEIEENSYTPKFYENKTEINKSDLKVNFAVVEEAYFETPAYDKYIVIDLGDGTDKFDSATLTIYNETTGSEMDVEADTISGSSIVFRADFPNENYTGKYLVKSLEYETKDGTYEKSLSDEYMLPRFGVNKVIKEEPNGWLVDESADTKGSSESVTDLAKKNSSVMDLSSDFVKGSAIGINGYNSDIAITQGKELAGEITSSASFITGTKAGDEKIVVVLDPGHCGQDTGAVRTWGKVTYIERDIALKIAFACKAELEKNGSIIVYMTRTDNTDYSMDDLSKRCKFAYDRSADLFVSFHLNAASSTAANGVEVYIPNRNYNDTVYTIGQEVGKTVLEKLVALGLTNRGYKIRNSENKTKYPDGSLADYLGVIRGCKQYGIPAILIEHGFLSNKSDCEKFFSTDAQMTALGVADAQGIIACIDTIKSGRVPGTSEGGWKTVDGKKVYYENGVPKLGFFTVAGKTYYGEANGYVAIGLRTINGYKYYFEADGAMLKSAWKKISGTKYYFTDNGTMAKGWVTISGKRYYFKSSGKRYKAGFRTVGGKKYNFKSGGYVATNTWKWNNGAQYYLGADGSAVKGLQKIKKYTYYFNKYGVMQYGWIKYKKKSYYLSWENGRALTGWHTIWGADYYFNKDGSQAKGFTKVKKKTYYFLKDGGYKTGWNKISKKMYYFNWKGVMQTGWTTYNNNKAYLKTDTGALAKNEFVTLKNGKTYYFNKKYAMQIGLKTISNEKYYFSTKGVLSKSKWVTADGATYYATADGKLAHDSWQTIDGKTYYFEGYAYVTGTKVINGITYVFDDTGVLKEGKAPETTTETTTEAKKEENKSGLYEIMGKSSITVDDMVKYYNSTGNKYPADSLKKGGAADIKTFCTILKEEAEAEGVKAEVLYAQVMLETGWLKFGGQVKISQYNFGGLGATDGGAAGASFKDIRTGLRAQTQHLKAYACTDALKNTCVDPRFKYVTRGSAKYVEYLGIKENPSGKGWATAEKYGYHIVDLIRKIK